MAGKPTIVLVHGFWGGAAHWSKVILELSRKGHTGLRAVELPLTSLADDAERTRKMVKQQPGPVLLVGHAALAEGPGGKRFALELLQNGPRLVVEVGPRQGPRPLHARFLQSR